MGTYLNPGKQNYQIATNSEIFVDKSEMILYLNSVLNTQQRYVSVSRPRRFGKTMAADMICAYYDREADSQTMFQKLKLAQTEKLKEGCSGLAWDTYLGKFDVLRVVMTKFFKKKNTVEEALEKLQRMIVREMKIAYPEVSFFDDADLLQAIDDVYSVCDRQVVLVIDEWDAVFRVRQKDKDGQTEYLDFLRDLVKDNSHIALAYLTGILPIKKYGEHSALNMFTEYSMTSPKWLAKYAGFTAEEVKELCKEKALNYKSMQDWYDGYRLSNIPSEELLDGDIDLSQYSVYEIYSPLSVVSAASFRRLENYWNKSETYEALAEYIRKDFDGLKEAVALLMDGGRLKINTATYQNDMTTFHGRDDVLSLLIHLGYLGYDNETDEVFIPNREILDEFKISTKSAEWGLAFESFAMSMELLNATWEKNAEKVADLLEKAHNKADNKTYNNEAALSYAVQLAYYAAQKYYTLIPEADTGKGYADLICVPSPAYPDKPALVIELKYNKDANGAIAQIKHHEYPDRLVHYKGKTLLVGINYDREVPNNSHRFKHHTCVIEEA